MSDSLVAIAVGAIIVALLVLATFRRRSRRRGTPQDGSFPAFSAETAEGSEAEYVDDRRTPRLPRWAKRASYVVLIAAALYLLIVQWPVRG